MKDKDNVGSPFQVCSVHSLCSASSLARTHLSQAGLYAEGGG